MLLSNSGKPFFKHVEEKFWLWQFPNNLLENKLWIIKGVHITYKFKFDINWSRWILDKKE